MPPFYQLGGHKHSGSRDIMIFVCHVTLFIGTFRGNGHCDSGNIMVLACHKILQYHMIKESCDFVGNSLSR